MFCSGLPGRHSVQRRPVPGQLPLRQRHPLRPGGCGRKGGGYCDLRGATLPLPCAPAAFVTKTLPLPCAPAAFVAKTLPLPCVPAAFVPKTAPFLAGFQGGASALAEWMEGEAADKADLA